MFSETWQWQDFLQKKMRWFCNISIMFAVSNSCRFPFWESVSIFAKPNGEKRNSNLFQLLYSIIKTLSIMKSSTRLLLLLFALLSSSLGFTQTLTVSEETFPFTFNLNQARPQNTTFQGDIGLWGVYSTDSQSYVTVNDAMKFYNWATAPCHLTAPSYVMATSPMISCHTACVSTAALVFDLYTHTVNQNNTCFTLKLEVSANNGSSWTTIWTRTAQQLYNAYGQSTWNSVSLNVPSNLVSSTFRYRFTGTEQLGCTYNNFLYIDNIKLNVVECGPNINVMKLGNLVWSDTNLNGVKDANESGVPNATVKLYKDDDNDNTPDGAAIATTTTNSSGIYMFSNLAPGNYIVGVIIPTGYVRGPNSTIDPDNNVDNDNNGVYLIGNNQAGGEVRSKAITLALGTEPTNDGDDSNGNLTLDIALCQPAQTNNLTLGNLIWSDANLNNIKDANESGVPNATVKLYKDANNDNVPDGAAIATTTTNASGIYTFNNLAAGNYIVGVIIPTGYVRGATTATDPDDNVDNDNNGVYLIGNNQPGSEVRSKAITLAAGTEPTNDGDGSNGNLTLDIGLCQPGTPNPGNLTLGNLVWSDANLNGVRDASEAGVPNATVYLYRDDNNDNLPDNAQIATTTTDANGLYYFNNLGAGNYIVGVVIPTGYVRGTVSLNDPDDNIDNDNNGRYLIGANAPGSIVRTMAITLAPGTEPTNDGDGSNGNLTLDIGLCNPGTQIVYVRLGNKVWNDNDGDGKKDPGETSIPFAPVYLYRDDNGDNHPDSEKPIDTTYSDLYGNYLFDSLAPGNYITAMPLLPGYAPSPNTSTQATSPNPNNNVDSDNNLVNFVGNMIFSNYITLTPGEEPTYDGDDANGNLTHDLAECGNLWIGDHVWNDLNGNGIQEANEPGINGVKVTCTCPDGKVFTTYTNNYQVDGYYDFPRLGPGTYKITFTAPAGLHPTRSKQGNDSTIDSNPVDSVTYVTLTPTASNFTIDAGFTSIIFRSAGKMQPIAASPVIKTSVAIYPNPVADYAVLNLTAAAEGKAIVRIVDASGRVVSQQVQVVKTGVNAITLNNMKQLRSGMYTEQALLNGEVLSERVSVTR